MATNYREQFRALDNAQLMARYQEIDQIEPAAQKALRAEYERRSASVGKERAPIGIHASSSDRDEAPHSALGIVFYILGIASLILAVYSAVSYPMETWPLTVAPFVAGALVSAAFGAILNQLKALRAEVASIAESPQHQGPKT